MYLQIIQRLFIALLGLRADAESWAIYSWQLGRAGGECKHCSRTGEATIVSTAVNPVLYGAHVDNALR